jgi:hypothetical protein
MPVNGGFALGRHRLLGNQKARDQVATTSDGFFAPLQRVCITVAQNILVLCKRFPKSFH